MRLPGPASVFNIVFPANPSLYVTVCHYVSLWQVYSPGCVTDREWAENTDTVSQSLSLCLTVCHYVSLCLIVSHYVSLCLIVSHYVSLQVYSPGCVTDREWAGGLASDTQYCYCGQDTCNNSTIKEVTNYQDKHCHHKITIPSSSQPQSPPSLSLSPQQCLNKIRWI